MINSSDRDTMNAGNQEPARQTDKTATPGFGRWPYCNGVYGVLSGDYVLD